MSISGVFNQYSHQTFSEINDFVSEINDFIKRKARFLNCYFESLFFGGTSSRLNYAKFGNYVESSAKNRLNPAYASSVQSTHDTVRTKLIGDGCSLATEKTKSRNAAVDSAMCLGMSLHYINEIIEHYDDEDFGARLLRVSKKFKKGGDAQDLAVTQINRDRNLEKPYDYTVQAAKCFYGLNLEECQNKNLYAFLGKMDLESLLNGLTNLAPQMAIHQKQTMVKDFGDGIYLIIEAPKEGVEYAHAIVFIKKSDLNVIFDPNIGMMNVPSAEVGAALDALLKYTGQSGMIFHRAKKE